MEDEVEAGAGEGRKIGHVAFDGTDVKPFPLGHLAINDQLARRVIEDRHAVPAVARIGPAARAAEARQSTSAPASGGNHARGTGMEGVSTICTHSPRRLAATASLLTGIVHGLPAAT